MIPSSKEFSAFWQFKAGILLHTQSLPLPKGCCVQRYTHCELSECTKFVPGMNPCWSVNSPCYSWAGCSFFPDRPLRWSFRWRMRTRMRVPPSASAGNPAQTSTSNRRSSGNLNTRGTKCIRSRPWTRQNCPKRLKIELSRPQKGLLRLEWMFRCFYPLCWGQINAEGEEKWPGKFAKTFAVRLLWRMHNLALFIWLNGWFFRTILLPWRLHLAVFSSLAQNEPCWLHFFVCRSGRREKREEVGIGKLSSSLTNGEPMNKLRKKSHLNPMFSAQLQCFWCFSAFLCLIWSHPSITLQPRRTVIQIT